MIVTRSTRLDNVPTAHSSRQKDSKLDVAGSKHKRYRRSYKSKTQNSKGTFISDVSKIRNHKRNTKSKIGSILLQARTLPRLSCSQWTTVHYASQGLTNSQIAAKLSTTGYMVQQQLTKIFDKLGLWNRMELALWYERKWYELLG